MALLMLLMGGGGIVAAIVLSAQGHRVSGHLASPTPERFLWDEVGGAPQLATVKGQELLVARFREGADDQLYVEARKPPQLARVWRTGPFGSYGDGYQATWFQIAGQRVVVTDIHAKAHVYDLSTGAELGTFPLSDRAARHGLSLRDGIAHVSTVDGKIWLIDPRSLTAAAAKQPLRDPRRPFDPFGATDLSTREAPRIPGFQATRVFTEDGVGVAVGHRVPGTPVPRVIGFTPVTGGILWTDDIASTDPVLAQLVTSGGAVDGVGYEAVAHDRLLTAFQQGDDYRIAAFDIHDGRHLWNVSVPTAWKHWAPQLLAGQSYCYILCTMGLAALDPASGRVVGAISPFALDD